MKTHLPVLAAALFLLLAAGATADNTRAEPGVPSLVWWLDNPAQESGVAVDGAFSTLQRGYYSVNLTLHTSGLTPGHTYSLWWVIFQNPASCVTGCGDDEINAAAAGGPNPAGISVHYGGSFTAPEDGRGEFFTRILEDNADGCAKTGPYVRLCSAMRDAATAETLVFLMDHGPSELVASGDFSSGCARMVWFGYVVADYHQGGFDCYRAQSTFHRP
jgi:hypothetical protein